MPIRSADIANFITAVEELGKAAIQLPGLPQEEELLLEGFDQYVGVMELGKKFARLGDKTAPDKFAKAADLSLQELSKKLYAASLQQSHSKQGQKRGKTHRKAPYIPPELSYDADRHRELRNTRIAKRTDYRTSVIEPLQEKFKILIRPLEKDLTSLAAVPDDLQNWLAVFLDFNLMALHTSPGCCNMDADRERIEDIQKKLVCELKCIRGALERGERTSPAGEGGEAKTEKPLPLPENAAAVYELLKTLPAHKGMTGKQILKALEEQKPPTIIDQSTLTKHIIPKLHPYGVKNTPGAGYHISK